MRGWECAKMRKYWFIYEEYCRLTCGWNRYGRVQKGVEIIAKNKYKAIEQFENQHPTGNIMKIKSYGVYLKI